MHLRSGYPLSGCVPAEPDSVSPDGNECVTIMKTTRRSKSVTVVVSSKPKPKPLKERQMNQLKYIGMDVYKATTVTAVRNHEGSVETEAIIQTKSSTILDFIKGQRGTLHVAFEEGTQAAWLYDLIQPHVASVVACDPRKIVAQCNKNDRIDAKRLAELLRLKALTPVYHGEQSARAVRELVGSYNAIVQDSTRIKNRLKAVFRARGIACSGSAVYSTDERKSWLRKLNNEAVLARANRLLEQLDSLEPLREAAEKDLLTEARKHRSDIKVLQSIPGTGPLRAAVLLGVAGTPHRFRTKRQLWTYSGLAVVTKASSEYELINGQVFRSKKQPLVRGLNRNDHPALKEVFKGAALSVASGGWKSRFDALVATGTRPSLAYVTLARKIAAITLRLWKRGEPYDEKKLNILHAA
jgi:transposase